MRRLKLLTIMIIVMTIIFAAVACNGDPILESITVKEGTISTTVVQGSTLDTSNLIVLAKYSDGTEKEIKANMLEIGEFSTAELGKKTLTIKYQDKTYNLEITVIEKSEEKPVESISPKSGTYVTQIKQGETLDTSKIVIIAKYTDGTSEEITADKLTFGEFSTDTLGVKTLKITYGEVSCNINITVVANDDLYGLTVIGATIPDNIVLYKSNIGTKNNKEEEFTIRDDGYFVGDDNVFYYKPNVAVVDEEDYPANIDEEDLDMAFTIEILEDNEYVEQDTPEEYVTMLKYGEFDFTEEAIGKTIKMTFKPFVKGHPESSNRTLEFEVKVIDGYNAYTAADLSMIDGGRDAIDSGEKDKADAWAAFKTAHGLPLTKAAAVVMQDNIKLTAKDIPDIFLFNDGDSDLNSSDSDYAKTNGSLRDYQTIYYRGILPNEKFEFIGNYYTLDAQEIPYVTREDNKPMANGKGVISHSQLIRVNGKNNTVSENEDQKGFALFKNFSIKGNANRSDSLEKGGGLIFHKIENAKFEINNVIARQWFITFFPQAVNGNVTDYLASGCKAYDAFNSFVYVWGGVNNRFVNCEMKGAGGPIFIIDHVYPNQEGGGYPSNVIVTDCTLESNVEGGEGWFNLVDAGSLIPTIKAINPLFLMHNKTFLRDENGGTSRSKLMNTSEDAITRFNLIAVIKSGEAQGPSSEKIKGNLAINDNTPLDFGDSQTQTSQLLNAYLQGLVGKGAPIFQSAKGGVATYMGNQEQGLVQLDASNNPQSIQDNNNDVFKGDYLNLYYGGKGASGYMGIMLGYYDVTD